MPPKETQPGLKPAETADATKPKTPEQAATPVAPETVVHAETRADLQGLQGDVLKAKLTKQEELKKTAAQQRKAEGWINNKAEEPNMLIGAALKVGIEKGVDDKVKEYTQKLKEFGLSDQNIEAISTAAKEFLIDHAKKNGNSIETTKSYASDVLPKKLKGLFDGLTATFNSKNFPFTSAMDCLTRFNDFAGLGILKGGNIDKNSFKNFLTLDESNFKNMLTGFNEFLALEKDCTTLKAGGTPASAPGSAPAAGPAGVPTGAPCAAPAGAPSAAPAAAPTGTPEAQPQAASSPTAAPSATPATAPTGTPPATPAATPETPPPAVKAAIGEIDSGKPMIDMILNLIVSFSPDMAKWFESFGWVQFAGLEAADLASAKDFKKAAKDYGLNLRTLAPLFTNKDKMVTVIKNMKDKNVSSWKDYFDQYLDESEKEKLTKKTATPSIFSFSKTDTIEVSELEKMFLSNREAQSGAAGAAAAAAGAIGERAIAAPEPAPRAPTPEPTSAPAPAPAAAPKYQPLSATDKADIARARAGLPAGAKGVSSVPQDVAIAAKQTLSETSGQDWGVKKIITGSDGKQYAMVREKHSGDSGHPNVHPGISVVEVPAGTAPTGAPPSAAA